MITFESGLLVIVVSTPWIGIYGATWALAAAFLLTTSSMSAQARSPRWLSRILHALLLILAGSLWPSFVLLKLWIFAFNWVNGEQHE